MDSRFYQIYRELVEEYHARHAGYWWDREEPMMWRRRGTMAMTDEMVERIAVVLGPQYELRPDARLFLATNLHQMVVLPLLYAGAQVDEPEGISEGLRNDVELIAESIRAVVSEEDRSDVAASHALWGVGRVLSDLSLKNWRLWDRM